MTRTEAIRQVLENLRVIDAQANPAAEDANVVGKRLDQARAFLIERGLCWWTADAIPDAVSSAFCAFVAERTGDVFNKPYSAPGAIKDIASVKSGEDREAVKTEYF